MDEERVARVLAQIQGELRRAVLEDNPVATGYRVEKARSNLQNLWEEVREDL